MDDVLLTQEAESLEELPCKLTNDGEVPMSLVPASANYIHQWGRMQQLKHEAVMTIELECGL